MPRTSGEAAPDGHVWRAQQECEVAGLASEGFAHAWFRGKLFSGVSKAGVCSVSLVDFNDGADACVEYVTVSRLRPPPPGQLAQEEGGVVCDAYPVGTHVDVYVNDVWWRGVVKRSGGGSIDVQHPGGAWRGASRRPCCAKPCFEACRMFCPVQATRRAA